MVYINGNGTIGGKKTTTRLISDFFGGIRDIIVLFFSTITSTAALDNNSGTRNYAQRNNRSSGQTLGRSNGSGGSRANIRGVGSLQKGSVTAAVGG